MKIMMKEKEKDALKKELIRKLEATIRQAQTAEAAQSY